MSRSRNLRRWLPFLGGGGGGEVTDRQQRVIIQANREPSTGGGTCLMWVGNVFEHALGISVRRATAYEDYLATTTYGGFDIPIAAVVYGTGLNSGGAGHIGIYAGNGVVLDVQGDFGTAGQVVSSTMDQWLSWQTDVIDGRTGYLGWGWYGNVNLQRGE